MSLQSWMFLNAGYGKEKGKRLSTSDCVVIYLYITIIMRHFVIIDNDKYHILNSKEAKKYIEDREWMLLENWYTYLGMSPNPYGFRNCLRNNISYIFDTRIVSKILLVFRKDMADTVIMIHTIYNNWFRI